MKLRGTKPLEHRHGGGDGVSGVDGVGGVGVGARRMD